jgi:hypothetical protein
MKSAVWLAALAGCGFEASNGATVDAAREPDAAVDAAIDVPDGPPPAIMLAQNAARSVTSGATIDCAYPAAQTAGNTNIVVVSWTSNAGEVQTLSDTAGNTYVSTNLTVASSTFSMRIYYAARTIPSPAGTLVTAHFPSSVPAPKLRILEYSGLAAAPFERGVSASGNGVLASSGAITTTTPHVLLFAPNVIAGVSAPVLPFVVQDSSGGDLIEAEEVAVPGTYTALASVAPSAIWVMMIAAFRGQ